MLITVSVIIVFVVLFQIQYDHLPVMLPACQNVRYLTYNINLFCIIWVIGFALSLNGSGLS